MAKQPALHPTLATPRLRLRQFRPEDAGAMHQCFANPEAMRFWNTPVHTSRIETERAVRRFIDCTPSYYRFWAVADLGTDRCPAWSTIMTATSAVSAWPLAISSIQRARGRDSAARPFRRCSNSASATSASIARRLSSIPTTRRLGRWPRNWIPLRRSAARQPSGRRRMARRHALRAARERAFEPSLT